MELRYKTTWPNGGETTSRSELEMWGNSSCVHIGSELDMGMEKDGFEPYHMDMKMHCPIINFQFSSWNLGKYGSNQKTTTYILAIINLMQQMCQWCYFPPTCKLFYLIFVEPLKEHKRLIIWGFGRFPTI
jgi:hypothetical protein